MTHLRRFPARTLALLALGGLATGCAGPERFSAGRLPYERGSQIAANDPFAGAANDVPTGHAATHSTAPHMRQNMPQTAQSMTHHPHGSLDDYSAPPGPESPWQREAAPRMPHQTAYVEPASTPPPGSVASMDTSFRPADSVQPMSHAQPMGHTQTMSHAQPMTTAEPNPFAAVEGHSPMPSYAAQPSYTAPPPSDEQFLPPIR